jgi:hypothetical protein
VFLSLPVFYGVAIRCRPPATAIVAALLPITIWLEIDRRRKSRASSKSREFYSHPIRFPVIELQYLVLARRMNRVYLVPSAMSYKLRFKVTEGDSPAAPLADEIVCIEFEPAFIDENLRRVVRSRINLETMMRDLMGDEQFREAFSHSGSVPLNYWPTAPMDVCKGEYNREIGDAMPKGEYGANGDWIPDRIVASAPTMDALIRALLDDVERVCREIEKSNFSASDSDELT